MGGRGPVHPAQRLARLVLAHAVQLVAAAAHALAHAQRVAGASERRVRELERRCDHREHGAAAGRVEPARETERILADQLARAELVQPAPQRPELVAAAQHAQPAADDGPQRAGLLHPVLAERRAARPCPRERSQLDLDRDALTGAGERRQAAHRNVRAAGEADPDARDHHGGDERRAEQCQLGGAEEPAVGDCGETAGECGAPARGQRTGARAAHSGTGTRASNSSTTAPTSAGCPAAGSRR